MISKGKSQPHPYRSLSIEEWPEADRAAWEVACRPGQRLRPGGPRVVSPKRAGKILCAAMGRSSGSSSVTGACATMLPPPHW